MYRVTHNGMEVKFLDTKEDVEGYIADRLTTYQNLNPTEIYRASGGETDDNYTISEVVIYRYKTYYSEMFMIEKEIARDDWGDSQ